MNHHHIIQLALILALSFAVIVCTLVSDRIILVLVGWLFLGIAYGMIFEEMI